MFLTKQALCISAPNLGSSAKRAAPRGSDDVAAAVFVGAGCVSTVLVQPESA